MTEREFRALDFTRTRTFATSKGEVDVFTPSCGSPVEIRAELRPVREGGKVSMHELSVTNVDGEPLRVIGCSAEALEIMAWEIIDSQDCLPEIMEGRDPILPSPLSAPGVADGFSI